MQPDTGQPYWLGEGCKNAFVLFDLLQSPELLQYEFLESAHRILLCEERDDALILLPHASAQQHLKVKMLILEPDQSLAAFCGNGARVVAAYLQKFYSERHQNFSIVAHDGEHELLSLENGDFGVGMPAPKLLPSSSVFVSEQAQNSFKKTPEGLWSLSLDFQGREHVLFFVESGEPHLVMCGSMNSAELHNFGAYLNSELWKLFPLGINVNQVCILEGSTISAMTYERGVNRITPACGTGAVSCATVCRILRKPTAQIITVQMPGGRLLVEYDERSKRSILQGPATLHLKIFTSPSSPRHKHAKTVEYY